MAATKKATKKTVATKRTAATTKKAAPAKKPPTAAKKPYPDNNPVNTKPPRSRPADAVDLLADDHLAVDKLFKQYEKLAKKDAPAAQRQALAEKICAMLKVHTQIEEEIFYPAARQARIDSDLMDEANVEHASAKELIGQIEGSKPGADYYDAKVKVLGDYVGHHVIEEHTEMFPKCRRSTMDLVRLGVQMAARKKELQARPGKEPSKPSLLSRISGAVGSR